MCDKLKLMYIKDLERLGADDDCPCDCCKELPGMPCFRYMYEESITSDDFVPQVIKAERQGRAIKNYIAPIGNVCSSMGLSCYTSAQLAIDNFKLKDGFPRMNPPYKHLGECVITNDDGVVSKPSRSGHFNIHPYEGAPMLTALTHHSALQIS